jgi:GNAT superfamily N-acetyltransferase
MHIADIIPLTESMDNPYAYRWDKQLDDHWVAKADTPAGLMLVMAEWEEADSSWTIDFAVGGRMGKSGAGDEFRIFATVVAVLKDWITKVDLSKTKLISFSADKSDDVGASRAKLYARFARQMASQLGWKLDVTSTDDGREQNDHFKLFNPNVSVTEEVEVSLHGDAEKGYVLSKIEVSGDERNAGQGTKAMQDIVDRMDREGAIIALTPDDAFGGNKNRLIKFYKRFGFVPNKGRNKDFRFRETMIRYPQGGENK